MDRVLRFMTILVSSLLALTFAQATPLGQMFLPVPAAEVANGANSTKVPGVYARQINPAVMQLKPGEEIELSLPNGKTHLVVFDRSEKHPNGDETWIGHVKSDDYRVLITIGKSSVVGQFRTPSGNFQLKTENGQQWLVDPVEAGHKEMPIDADGLKVPKSVLPPRQGTSFDRSLKGVAAVAANNASSTIDVAVLYSPGMITRWGSDAIVQTRINYLVALSNQAYIDSGISVTLRLVHTEQANYPSTNTLDFALQALSASENASYSSYSDASMANVKTMRDLYGADLVSFVRPFNSVTDTYCGLSWLNGGGGTTLDSRYGYSTVDDGDDIAGTQWYCSEYTFAHELGHNMGSQHDVANADEAGAFPYSYGYGIPNVFGTIMSYIDPVVGKFSSPLVTCNGSPCGVADQADNARSINNLRATIANFRMATVGLPPASISPQSGWWWNPNEGGRGYFIEVKNGRFFTGSYLYDNSGYPLWYVTGPAAVSGSTLPGTLGAYSGGQTLTGAYKSPTGPTFAGNMNITFSDTTHGTITWPGGSVPITRYELATGSLSLPDPSFKPETGWWWNASEGGRGFSVEVQGDNLFIAGFMYDASGNPVWYVSAGKMSNPWVYYGTWAQYANGQSMGGVFKAATVKDPNVGSIAIGFTSATTATLYLPDGTTRQLTRYSF